MFRLTSHEDYKKLEGIEDDTFFPVFTEVVIEVWDGIFLEDSILTGIFKALGWYLLTFTLLPPLFFYFRYLARRYRNDYPERFI